MIDSPSDGATRLQTDRLAHRESNSPSHRVTRLNTERLASKHKLQALVYDILPPATAIIGYAIGLRNLSANWHFFVGAQMTVCM